MELTEKQRKSQEHKEAAEDGGTEHEIENSMRKTLANEFLLPSEEENCGKNVLVEEYWCFLWTALRVVQVSSAGKTTKK